MAKQRKDQDGEKATRGTKAAAGGRPARPATRAGAPARKTAPARSAPARSRAPSRSREAEPEERPRRAAEIPPARSSSTGRPRIKASHAEASRPGIAARPAAVTPERRARARATLRAVTGAAGAPERSTATGRVPRAESAADALPPPSARTGAKRRSVPPLSPHPGPSSAARELALAIAGAGLEKKAVGVEVLDVTGKVDYAEFLVVMTGTSDRHVHAIAMGIDEALGKKKMKPLSIEGLQTAAWVLMDYSDVVVHVFQEDTRKLYDIEGLWIDAGRLPVSDTPPA